MKRLLYILLGLSLTTIAFADKVSLQPDEDNWQTIMPNDTLVLSEVGKYKIKITEIGKYHFEQTTKDTIDFMLRANNLVDEKIKNGLPSSDTLQLSFKNVTLGRKLKMGSPYSIITLNDDTCNMSLSFSGKCTLTEISNVGYNTAYINIKGKSPKCHIQVQDSITCKLTMNSARISFIDTSLDKDDSLHYEIHPNATLITSTIKNLNGNVFYDNCNLKDFIIEQGEKSSMFIKNTTCEKNDYSWHNAVIYSKGKIYIENSTLQTTNSLTFIESGDTIFIDEKEGERTYIDALIGSKRNPLNETEYSRVVVNNATYIREITAMTDLYNGNIGTICPSPQVKDILSYADVNIYGGKIGLLTNKVHSASYGSFLINYGNRNINFYNGAIHGSTTGIRLGYWYANNVTNIEDLCTDDTLTLHKGSITVPETRPLFRFSDNTLIKIKNQENDKFTQIQYNPLSGCTVLSIKGGEPINDSLKWDVGNIKQLKSLKSDNSGDFNTFKKRHLRLVYRNSEVPTDTLVVGVNKDSTHYFGSSFETYDRLEIAASVERNIYFINTLDDTWETSDNKYWEGFGMSKLPRVIYAGKTFKGWYTAPDGGVKMDSISHLQMGDITLYTQWGPGQDIIYSDFDKNILCNTGAKNIIFYNDAENEIISHGRPLEGYDTKAMYCNVTKNNGDALISFYLRDSYPNDQSIYKNAPRVYMDLRSTTGISFMHKGISVVLGIGTKASETASKNKITIPAHETLTLVNIPWGQFSNATSFDLEHVCKMQFKPVEEQGEFWLDNIIFTQGEIYPIEKIQLDTIPNKYLYSKNPNLLDIPLPKNTADKQLYLYPKFTPSDATYQAIAWSSADTTIVKVDDYGRVSGINHGQTYIYCQSIMQPEVKDSILVGVAEGGIYYDLNGVSISNELPSTYNYSNPTKLPNPEPLKNFYTFHAWHTDSITGAIVDSASYHQFGNLKAHKLFAEFTREIPGAAITLLQNRIVAVQNPYNYDELKTASYNWQYNETPLLSNKMYVEVGLPIPIGNYNVTIYIDDEMPIKLEREINENDIVEQDILNVSVYPNPIQSGGLAHIVGTYDTISLIDTKGQKVPISTSSKDIIKMPEEKGVYILNITCNQQQYNIKMIVM